MKADKGEKSSCTREKTQSQISDFTEVNKPPLQGITDGDTMLQHWPSFLHSSIMNLTHNHTDQHINQTTDIYKQS